MYTTDFEHTFYHVDPAIPDPYQNWIQQRNRNVADVLSRNSMLINENADRLDVLSSPIQLTDRGLYGTIYGACANDPAHVHKTMLHPSIGAGDPQRDSYARMLQNTGITLMGLTIPRQELLAAGVNQMFEQGFCPLRIKAGNESDMVGQFAINHPGELAAAMETTFAGHFPDEGLVLEPNLESPHTLSVGKSIVNGHEFAFIARQTEVDHEGRKKFGGAVVTVFDSSLASLSINQSGNLSAEERTAVVKAGILDAELQQQFGLEATRISYDVLFGEEVRQGRRQTVSGITDITARVGGTDPAIQLAIEKILTCRQACATAEVKLYYHSNHDAHNAGHYLSKQALLQTLLEQGSVVFLYDPDNLVIGARIIA